VNLILILKELWRRRILVVLAALLAVAVAVVAIYQVSLAPPSLSKRSQVTAAGSIEVLVDSARSPIAGARRDLSGLTARAGVFARLMAGGNVIGQIASDSGIPPRKIDVAGPTPLAGEAPGIAEAPQLNPYGITFTSVEELPIVSVVTRAPTVAAARALAAAAPRALGRLVRAIQERQETPPAERVELRVLGPPEANVVDDSLGKKMAIAIFFVVFALEIGLILAVPRLRAAWKAVDIEASPADPPAADDGRHFRPDLGPDLGPEPGVDSHPDLLSSPSARVPQRQEY
jgi:hypothetical protein